MALRAERTEGPAGLIGLGAESGLQLLPIIDAARAMGPEGILEQDLRYREFLDAVGVAVYTTDASGRLTFFNEAAAAFWGRRPVLGEEWWCGSLRLLFSDGRPMRHEECPMAVALQENRPVRGAEAYAVRPDGSRIAFVPYPTPLHDDDGRLVGAVNVLVDVSAQKEAQESLRASNAVKDEFLGLVSHELRTPVTTIFGNAQVLRERGDRLPAGQRDEMVADIAVDASRLLAIVENLLHLTRLGSGAAEADLEPQVLDLVVNCTVGAFAKRHPERQIVIDDDAERLIVEADRTYLELILDNLLSNAVKYSPPGTPIEVRVEANDPEAMVIVRDRGIGLDEATIAQLFTPFFRSDQAKRTANGIGVGLAVCRRVAEAMGGRMWAAPREGGGAEIGLALPIAGLAEDAG